MSVLWFLGSFGAACALVFLVGWFMSGCVWFGLSRDASALKSSIVKTTAAPEHEDMEISVGGVATFLARSGLKFIDLDPHARAVIESVRSAEVGVYRLDFGRGKLSRAAIMEAADSVLLDRGWDRLVRVSQDGTLIAFYVSARPRSADAVNICGFVLNGRQLIVLSARSKLQPVLDLAAGYTTVIR